MMIYLQCTANIYLPRTLVNLLINKAILLKYAIKTVCTLRIDKNNCNTCTSIRISNQCYLQLYGNQMSQQTFYVGN